MAKSSSMKIKSIYQSSHPEGNDMMAGLSASSILSNVDSVNDPRNLSGTELISKDPSLIITPVEPRICPHCGKEVPEPEIKLIPGQRAWLCFAFLFFCLLWWISWIPFLVDKCKFKKPVQMCPHCYRRLNRPPV